VIEAMGAGRRAARSMKAYLGIRDPEQPYAIDGRGSAARMFGLDPAERNFARVRVG
jgi:glutamate synthase (NADPH/NADH) small chain